MHSNKEKPPKLDGAFGCEGSVGEGDAVASLPSSSKSDGLEVEVADADFSTVAVGVDVVVSMGFVVAVGVWVGVSVGTSVVSNVASVVIVTVVGDSVAVDAARETSGVTV